MSLRRAVTRAASAIAKSSSTSQSLITPTAVTISKRTIIAEVVQKEPGKILFLFQHSSIFLSFYLFYSLWVFICSPSPLFPSILQLINLTINLLCHPKVASRILDKPILVFISPSHPLLPPLFTYILLFL